MAIVNSYVKLPEGNQNILSTSHPGAVESPEEDLIVIPFIVLLNHIKPLCIYGVACTHFQVFKLASWKINIKTSY